MKDEVELGLELLAVVEEDDVDEDVMEVLVLLPELEGESTTKAPIATITITTMAPIITGVETPRLVRMLLIGLVFIYKEAPR